MSDRIFFSLFAILFLSVGVPLRIYLGNFISLKGGLSQMSERKSYIFHQLKLGANIFIYIGILCILVTFMNR